MPQLDFRAATASARVLKEEEPFHCIRCDKPFGVKSTIERVIAKLEGKHWMFKGQAQRLEVLKMCEDCRVFAVTDAEKFDPYGKHPGAAEAAHHRRLPARAREEGSDRRRDRASGYLLPVFISRVTSLAKIVAG